jgi:hypothetical protein
MEFDTQDEARKSEPRAIIIAKTRDGKFVPFTTYEAYEKWKDAQ